VCVCTNVYGVNGFVSVRGGGVWKGVIGVRGEGMGVGVGVCMCACV
jgi:hypothetical protein